MSCLSHSLQLAHSLPFAPLTTVAVLIVCLVALGVPAMAQTESRPAAEPDAATRALVERIEAARAVAKLPKSLRIAGRYEVRFEGMPGDAPIAAGGFDELYVGADHARQTTDMGEMGKLERGITSELAWELDPSMGPKRYDGAAGASVRRYFAVLRGEGPAASGLAMQSEAVTTIEGRECEVLLLANPAGRDERWFVDVETARLVRIAMALPSPDSAASTFDMAEWIDATIDFSDWHEHAGVTYAQRRVLKMGPATVLQVCEKFEPDVPLELTAFAPPAAVAKLPPRTASRPAGEEDAKPFEIVEREPQAVASIRVQCRADKLSATLAVILPEVMAHLTATGAKPAGAPFSRYHSFEGGMVDLEAGIPVAKPIEAKGRVENGELPGGRVLTTWHIGPYDKLGPAHTAMQAHASSNDLVVRGAPWEVYWTDPGMVPDPSKWRTQLFLPVE